MKIAYLIIAHQHPHLLARIIKRLSSESCAFFIHIDRKSDITPFLSISGDNVFFVKDRIPLYWAEFSMVEVELLLMRRALAGPEVYDYLILLSGSDFPLASAAHVEEFIEQNFGNEFLSVVRVPAPGKPLSRITTLRYPSTKPVRRFISRALAKVGLTNRNPKDYIGTLELYAGNTWWALTKEACRYILDFVESNPQVVKFFENSFVPDEALFQTILANSAFKSRITRNLLYEDWSAAGPHPAKISDKHLDFFEAQEKVLIHDAYGRGEALFARKFSEQRLDLIDRIDAIIQKKESLGMGSPAQTR
jgi:hypothetical protein